MKKQKKFTVQMRIEGTLIFKGVKASDPTEAMVKVDNEMMGDADLSQMDFTLIVPDWAKEEGRGDKPVVMYSATKAEKFYNIAEA